jgi:hypothetical protein
MWSKITGIQPISLSSLVSRSSIWRVIDLTGSIPTAFGNLTGLAIFNASYNQLSRIIPRDNSLAQFGFISFFGNPDLCRAPWALSCLEVESPATPPSRTPPTTSIPANNVKGKQRRPFLTKTGIFVIAITAQLMWLCSLSPFSVLKFGGKRNGESLEWCCWSSLQVDNLSKKITGPLFCSKSL